MDTDEVLRAARADPYISRFLVGVYSLNTLPKQLETNATYILNLSPDWSSGSHWTALSTLFTSRVEDTQHPSIFFFNSFGLPPPYSIKESLRSISEDRVYYSDVKVQHFLTRSCGFITLHFLALVSRGFSPMDILLRHFFPSDREPFKNEILIQPVITELAGLKKRPILVSPSAIKKKNRKPKRNKKENTAT